LSAEQVEAETQMYIRTKAESDTVLAQALIQEQLERDAAAPVNPSQQPVAAASI
jgi:hypothetical protein